MKCFELSAHDAGYRLAQVERSMPTASPGRVIMRVRAVSLNYRDLINLRNQTGRIKPGRILTSDGSGEIVAVGEGVHRVKVGDRVANCFFSGWKYGPFDLKYHQFDMGGTIDGMLTEYADLDAESVVPIPGHMSFEEAACLPCAGVTAWNALVTRGAMQSGNWVLALGTGGVSILAAQMALAMGGRVIVTSSSDEKLARARELGVHHGVNYRSHPDWEKEVWKITNKQGVAHVIEVGGPGTLGKSLACVVPNGHVALIGVLTGTAPPAEGLFGLMARNANMSGIYVGSRDDFLAMNRFLAQKELHPVIDRVFDFGDAEAAFRWLESGSHFGKVVVRV